MDNQNQQGNLTFIALTQLSMETNLFTNIKQTIKQQH